MIAAPAEKVWEILCDTQLWPQWGPSVQAVDCPQRYIAQGVRGRLQTPAGFWVGFEIDRFEPPYYWDWKVAGVPATGHRLTALGSDSCELSFEMPAFALLYALVCRRALKNIHRLAMAEPIAKAQEAHSTH